MGSVFNVKPYNNEGTKFLFNYLGLKSTCGVNLLSKLSIIFKEWRVMNNVDRSGVISLCTLDTIHRLFFVTRLIINKINTMGGF